jgi:GH24 family phage-related lysozyme (muramidase)
MHPSVREAFPIITAPHEGDIPHLYRDSLGLVTVGMGRLVDSGNGPTQEALRYPFKTRGGMWASEAVIAAEFAKIKAGPKGAPAAAKIATLFLDQIDRDTILYRTLDAFEQTIIGIFPEWATWPADGQLALLSMAWNVGPAFDTEWPTLTENLRRQNFLYAAENAIPRDKTTGEFMKAARWRQNNELWTHAAGVIALKRDPTKLWLGQPIVLTSLEWAVKNPNGISVVAWYVQRQLQILGHYTGPLDGQFGKMSRAAYSAYCKAKNYTDHLAVAHLTALGKDAKLPLPVKAQIGDL